MAVPQYRDEVLVTLSSINPPSTFSYPQRRLFLTKDNPIMDIGRTSKRNSALEAAKNNGWFDSAVMSRDHAQIQFDSNNQQVYIKDIGSLHGTFKNDVAIERNAKSSLDSGDVLQFGVAIDRGKDKYPPCVMKTRLQFGTACPHERTNHFSVPDESDVDDSDMEGEQSILETQKRMHQAISQQLPATASPATVHVPSHEQPPISYARADHGFKVEVSQITSSLPTHALDTGDNNHIDLTSEPSDDESEPSGFSPISPGTDLMMGIYRHDDGVPASEGSDIMIDDDSDDWRDTSISESTSDSLSHSPSPSVNSSPNYSPNYSPIPDSQELPSEQASQASGLDFHIENEDQAASHGGFGEPPLPQSPATASDLDLAGAPYLAESDDVPPVFSMVSPSPKAIPAPFESLAREVQSELFDTIDRPGLLACRSRTPDRINKLPSLAADTRPNSTLRLPSLAEATSLSPQQCVRFQETQASGILGEKTGKHEYFRAREVNKNQVASLPPQAVWPCLNEVAMTSVQLVPSVLHSISGEAPSDPPSSPGPAVGQVQAKAEDQMRPPDKSGPPSLMHAEKPEVSKADFEKPCLDSQGVATNLPSAYDASSAAELQKMRREAREAWENQTATAHAAQTQEPEIPEVEMVSAETQLPLEKKQQADGSEVPEAASSCKPVSKKRKVAEISSPTPEEEDDIVSRPRRVTRRRLNRVRFAEPPNPPPSNRLRRAAEVVGYAALGGVAVMSALIATAPTL